MLGRCICLNAHGTDQVSLNWKDAYGHEFGVQEITRSKLRKLSADETGIRELLGGATGWLDDNDSGAVLVVDGSLMQDREIRDGLLRMSTPVFLDASPVMTSAMPRTARHFREGNRPLARGASYEEGMGS